MTLQEALTRRGIRFRIGSNDKLHLNCPFCIERGKPEDTKQRLCIHLKQLWGKCVHCEWSRKFAVRAVLRQLLIDYNVSGYDPPEKEKVPVVHLPEDFQVLTKTFESLDRKARRYILMRGVTLDQIKRYKIGVSYTRPFSHRILFPIYVNGKLKGINARDFTGIQKPKYLLSKGEKYFYHFNPEAETVILSEGVIKALRIEQVTKHCSASLLGHDLTDIQLMQLRESKCKHVILYPDPDPIGRRGFVKIADKLVDNWSNGVVSFVHPVQLPADDEALDVLRLQLSSNLIRYTGLTRPKFLL